MRRFSALFFLFLLVPLFSYASLKDYQRAWKDASNEIEQIEQIKIKIDRIKNINEKLSLYEKALKHAQAAIGIYKKIPTYIHKNHLCIDEVFCIEGKLLNGRDVLSERLMIAQRYADKFKQEIDAITFPKHIDEVFSQKRTEANQHIEIVNFLISDLEKNINEICERVKKAIIAYESVLNEIFKSKDPFVLAKVIQYQKASESTLETLQKNLSFFEEEKMNNLARKIYNDAFTKWHLESVSVEEQSYPAHLKDIPVALQALIDLKKTTTEALRECNRSLQLLSTYTNSSLKNAIKNTVLYLEKKLNEYEYQIKNYYVIKKEQKNVLKDHVLLLESTEETLTSKKIKESILEELIDSGEDYVDKLKEVKDQVAYLETKQEILAKKIPLFSDEEFVEIEANKRHEFYNNCPSVSPKNISYAEILASIDQEKQVFAIPLNESLLPNFQLSECSYRLSLDQFYDFLIQDDEAVSELQIDVFRSSEIIHSEHISLAQKSNWNHYVVEDGFVGIPETSLIKEFGLDIRLLAVQKNENDLSFIIKLKGSNPDYTFSVICKETELCKCSFIASPPWQLEVLRKTALPYQMSLWEKQNPYFDSFRNYSSNQGVTLTRGAIPLLQEFVKEMKNDPIAIAQYVQNEIELVEFNNVQSGSVLFPSILQRDLLGTFLEKSGSSWEQCQLLAYLLKNAGYKTKYAQATLELPREYIEKLFNLKTPLGKKIDLKYPFVLVFDNNQWISLFPWMKDIDLEVGHDPYNFLSDQYASAEKWVQKYLMNDPNILHHVGADDNDTAGVIFPRFVEDEVSKYGLSLQDIGIHRSIRKKQFVNWQDFPRPQVQEDIQVVDEINLSNSYQNVKIEISSKQNPYKKLDLGLNQVAQITYSPYTFYFEPLSENNHSLIVLKNNNFHSQLNLDASDHDIEIKITFESWSQIFSVVKGTSAAICFNTGTSSSQVTSFFGERYVSRKDETSKLHALLSFMGALYFDKCNRSEKTLANLHKLLPITFLRCGLAKLSPETSQGLTGKPLLRFPQVDMHHFGQNLSIPYALNCDQERSLALRQFALFECVDQSANEHQVLRDFFQDKYAISTVKLLQIAHEAHQNKGLSGPGFLTFTRQSLNDADKSPIFAQSVYFNHLKGLNLSKVKAQAATQWDFAKSYLKSESLDAETDFAYAYMTPGPISSKDGNGLQQSSYTGMGTLIINSTGYMALISDGSRVMNGGYGSRLPIQTIDNIMNKDWKIVPLNNSFSLLPSDYIPMFNGVSPSGSIITDTNIALTSNPKLDSFSYGYNGDKVKLSDSINWKSDVRPGHKSSFDTIADPVDVVSGAFFIDEIDLTLPGPFSLQVRRNYNNQNPLPGILGIGWKLSLNPYLIEEGDHLFAAEEDGTVINYRLNPKNARWEVFPEDNLELRNYSQKGIGSTFNPFNSYIEKNQDYILHGSDGSIRRFENKFLKQWTNCLGCTLTFSYDQEQLIRIENSNGGFLGFKYDHERRISEAYTKDGRRVSYHYDFQGNLTGVELPNQAIVSYEYDALHQILREKKPHGKILENIYQDGKVVEQRSPNGRQQQMCTTAKFIYGDGITTATDANGSTTEYKIYKKQIYKITDPEGNQILHSNFIDSHSWFDAETEQQLPWDELGGYQKSLKSSTDKRGLVTEYRYDKNGNPIEISLNGKDLTGNGDQKIVKRMEYNESNLCVLEEALYNKTVTIYDNYLPKRIEKYSKELLKGYVNLKYNEQGQVVSQDNTGSKTLWEYDSRGFPIKRIQKTGTEDPDVVVSFQYNHQGQCIEEISEDAMVKTDYDIMGNPYTSSVYDLSGNLISTKYFTYDLNNELTSQTGDAPYEIVYIDYNAAGKPKATRQLLSKAAIVSSMLNVEESGTAYSLYDYDACGYLILEVDPLGHSTYREYDHLGRISKVTKAQETTQFFYEAGGLLSQTILPNGAKSSREYTTNGLVLRDIYPDATEASFKYDCFGRCISETKDNITRDIEYEDISQKVIYRYPEIGITKIEELDSFGNIIATTDAEGNIWKKTYDHLGRLKSETDPAGNQTVWSYQNDSICCTLPSLERNIQRYKAGKVIESQTFDPQGNLIDHILSEHKPFTCCYKETHGEITTTTWTNTQGKPIAIQQGDSIIVNHYDPCGNCVATIDGEGQSTLRKFDAFNRQIHKTLPDQTEVEYKYDSNSSLIACNLPGGVIWQASYDLMGRKLSEGLKADKNVLQQWRYTYEQGRLKEAVDPNQCKHSYSYDNLGKVVHEKANEHERFYSYDKRGLLSSVEQIGDDHTKVERSYDSCGRLAAEEIYLNSKLLQKTEQIWNPAKRTLQVEGHQRDFYYLGGRLKQVDVQGFILDYDYNIGGAVNKKTTPYSTALFSYQISSLPKSIISLIHGQEYLEKMDWNKTNKITSYSTNWFDTEKNKSFSYAPRGYLKAANDESYVFDFDQIGCGVRTSAPSWTTSTDGIDPFGRIISELSQDKLITTAYDPSGQVISKTSIDDGQVFKWDPWGRLVEISCNTYTWKASYDAFGRRLQTTYTPKKGKSLTIVSLYDPEKEFEEIGVKYEGKTFWKISHHNQCEVMLDEDGNAVSLIYDVLGCLIAVVDSEKIHWSRDLASPYGPTVPPQVLEPTLVSFASSHCWQSMRVDPTGYIWMGARYYDPLGGRFLSCDPVGVPFSLDLYSYANGDPINFNDPDGRFASAVYNTTSGINDFVGSIVSDNLKNLSPYHLYKNVSTLGTYNSTIYTIPGYSLPNRKIIYCGGILTPFNRTQEIGAMVSELAGGYEVDVVYNPTTKSPVLDCLRWAASCKFGFKTDVVDKIKNHSDLFFENSTQDARILLICYSEGVTNARNYLRSYDENLRKRIDVFAYCPSAYIDEDYCGNIAHYCSEGDFVHHIVCESFEPSKSNVVFLLPNQKASWFDHDAKSPTFTEVLEKRIQSFLER